MDPPTYEQTAPRAGVEVPLDADVAGHANTAGLGPGWDEVVKQATAAGLDTAGCEAQATAQIPTSDATSPAISEHQMASPNAFYGTPSQRTGNENAARRMFSLEETAAHTAEREKLERSLDWLNNINVDGSYTPSPDERSSSNVSSSATYVTTQQDVHASNVIGRGVKRARTEAHSPADPQEAAGSTSASVAGADNSVHGLAQTATDPGADAVHAPPAADESLPAYGPDDFQSSDFYACAKLAFEEQQARKNADDAAEAGRRGRQLTDSQHAPPQTPSQPSAGTAAYAQGAPQHGASLPAPSASYHPSWQGSPAARPVPERHYAPRAGQITGAFALRTATSVADDGRPTIQYATSATRTTLATHPASSAAQDGLRMDVDPQENVWRSNLNTEYAQQPHQYPSTHAQGAPPTYPQPERPLFTFTSQPLPGAAGLTREQTAASTMSHAHAHTSTHAHAPTSAPANMYEHAPQPANAHTYAPLSARAVPAHIGAAAPAPAHVQVPAHAAAPVPAPAPAGAHAPRTATGVTSFRRPATANAPQPPPVIVATTGIPWMRGEESTPTRTQPAPGLHTAPAARDHPPRLSSTLTPPPVQHAHGEHELPMSLPSLPLCASFRDGETRALWLTEKGVLQIAPRPTKGFPERVTHGPLDMARHHNASVLEDWGRQPYGTACALEIFHQPLLTSRAMFRVYYFHLYDMLVEITGETTFELTGPPINGAINKWDRSTLWLAKKFSTDAVRVLCTYWAWSGVRLSFLATVKIDEIPKYVKTLEEFIYSEANPINLDELYCLVRATIRDSIVTFFASPDYARLQTHADAIANAAEVKLQNYGPRSGKQGKIVAIVSCPPPTMNPTEWTNWRDHLRTYEYTTAANGNPRLRRVARCDGCHGADHPSHLCPFRKVPGWHNPEDDDIACGVSVGNATRVYNAAPAQFYQPPANVPSGSTRVAVGNGGASFSRPAKGNAQGGGKARRS
ncbi:hypothetical protein VTO73DRAFT_2575 [Trametes versicolor]